MRGFLQFGPKFKKCLGIWMFWVGRIYDYDYYTKKRTGKQGKADGQYDRLLKPF